MLLPPRWLSWTVIALLTGAALARPLRMAARADPFTRPAEIPTDLFVAFWMPVTERLSSGMGLMVLLAGASALLVIPFFTRRAGQARPAPSVVDEELCTGCVQCSIDCPYAAIEMVPRAGSARSLLVAHVQSDLCVSCGICAGSCAPMGVGPPGRTGRDQLAEARAFVARPSRRQAGGELVVVTCAQGAGAFASRLAADDVAVYPVNCAGNLHTSVIELLIRSGSAGVLVLACPPRDCWNREGPKWLNERVYHDREAELQERVDRRRVRIAWASAGEVDSAVAALRDFRSALQTIGRGVGESQVEIDAECVPAELEESQ
jgi:coenzyme F420-reducing hydrogenase delta subunit/Pyruvate/2-oxoacid:ferredoxin oxidoreductase delta subunit